MTPLTVACVPTGMKTGVSMTPCAVWMQAGARAGVGALGVKFETHYFNVRE